MSITDTLERCRDAFFSEKKSKCGKYAPYTISCQRVLCFTLLFRKSGVESSGRCMGDWLRIQFHSDQFKKKKKRLLNVSICRLIAAPVKLYYKCNKGYTIPDRRT